VAAYVSKVTIGNIVIIQQDDAKLHSNLNGVSVKQDDFGITLIGQPPNNLNIKVFNIGIFCVIQSL